MTKINFHYFATVIIISILIILKILNIVVVNIIAITLYLNLIITYLLKLIIAFILVILIANIDYSNHLINFIIINFLVILKIYPIHVLA